jgi:hypothetical protein
MLAENKSPWPDNKSPWPIYLIAAVSGILGVLFIVLASEHATHGENPNIWRLLLGELGVALVVFALLEVALHVPLLREYFIGAIRDAIVRDEYLDKLSPEALGNLTSRIFDIKAAHNPQTGFLSYVKDQAFSQLANPFRTDLESEIVCSEGDAATFLITDSLAYTCKSAAKRYQEIVSWSNDPGEIEEIKSLVIQIREPGKAWQTIATADAFKFFYDNPTTGLEEAFVSKQPGRSLKYSKIEKEIPLQSRKDGLRVRIASEYLVKKDTFQFWRMTHLTDKFTLVLRGPEGYDIDIAVFEPDEPDELLEIEKDPSNYRRIKYNSWAVPHSGVSWLFRKRTAVMKAQSSGSIHSSGETAAGDSEEGGRT